MHEQLVANKVTQLLSKMKELFGAGAEAIMANYDFSDDYLLHYGLESMVSDIKLIENLTESNRYALNLSVNNELKDRWQIRLIKLDDEVSLSRGLPIVENFGFKLIDEHPYRINLKNGRVVHVGDFGVQVPEDVVAKINDAKTVSHLTEALVAVFNRYMENDPLNKLVVFSGLSVREVMLIRAVLHYLVQTSLPFSRQYMAECIGRYPQIATNLFALFASKFDLSTRDEARAEAIYQEIVSELEQVTNLDDDRILSGSLAVINAMLRTNYYQLSDDGAVKPYIAFKLESKKIQFLPKPLPLYEIFVYSQQFEAIHLRGGKVARGGLRWSDRREDFRTEVLGLVKAQIVKNSVIVPTGSKGGFVCKKLPPIEQREAYMAEAVSCYKTFIAGLLDITDNIVAGKIVPPRDVIRYDEDDPYLVVAADKGTATFSDYANEMSLKYGFWLGDAFASGGSAGYDHKKMGITAKGAWESAKRHFRHLNINIQEQDFTVVGIGDMAGDVFGNGMLLSKHIRLVAAFNHQHIFIDPNPDAATSFLERERLFNLPRSSWDDYDSAKISTGGGVFARSSKAIKLSNEIKVLLGITIDEISPNDLINLLLKAQVDMLYNGGIGTYIKAESESNESVKDKANDSLRVNGGELRVKVVVEGGNLGVTQLGRIEFAKNGGAIYTDAIDNSAGVDCSDHEVNIKILFAAIMSQSDMSIATRNEVLATMTDDIAGLVLRDNYLQTSVLQYASTRATELFEINVNFIQRLEKLGELDRSVEFLPNQHEIDERKRQGIGLTLPELSVLLAYSKIIINRQILHSNLLQDSTFDELLFSYFPRYLQDKYEKFISEHYLRKEIIATQLANLVVNRMGITFVGRLEDEFKVGAEVILPAFWVVYKLTNAEKLFSEIEALDGIVSAQTQIELLIHLKKALERTSRWVLRKVKNQQTMLSLITDYSANIIKLMGQLNTLVDRTNHLPIAKAEEQLVASGVPEALASVIMRIGAMPQLLDIVMLASETGRDLEIVARNYFYIGLVLRMDWIRRSLIALPENNKWQALSRLALLDDGYTIYTTFIHNAIDATTQDDENFAKTWIDKEPLKIQQINALFDELQSYKIVDLAMLSAAVRELRTILLQ